jgi:uncharacterized membrane protein
VQITRRTRQLLYNLYIGLTKSDLSLHFWVDRSDSNQTLLLTKDINFFLQIIEWTFYLLNTFRTNVRVNFGGFTATMS